MSDPISIVASIIGPELARCFFSLLKGAFDSGRRKNDVESLYRKLEEIVAVVEEAERRKIRSRPQIDWLEELNEARDDAEDLLSISSTQQSLWKLKKKVPNLQFHAHKLSFKHSTAVNARKILAKLEEMLQKHKHYMPYVFSDPHHRCVHEVEKILTVSTTPLPESVAETLGRLKERDEIVNWLISDGFSRGGCISVKPIVGEGGMGKTTLAKLVYDDLRVQNHFEPKMWVCVTQNFSLERILEGMEATASFQILESRSPRNPSLELQHGLKNKRFLLVLDDVWTNDYSHWKSLETIIGVGEKGSRVIVTSRHSDVFGSPDTRHVYSMPEMCHEDCWSLFCKNAFPSNARVPVSAYQSDLGRGIVIKCKGVPLSVAAIGCLLRNYDVKAWEDIFMDPAWQSGIARQSQILPALKLSFDHLPHHLKKCFKYCSIFPKSHVFDKNELVKLWMALGYTNAPEVPGLGMEEREEDRGIKYFNQLLARSFFRREGNERFKMHHLIHDLALTVSNRYYCQVRDSDEPSLLCAKTHHVSLICQDVKLAAKKIMEECPKIHTILSPTESSNDFGEEVLHRMFRTLRYIRVLDLSSSTLTRLPKSIKELKLLRYLDLSNTGIQKLPKAVCSLLNLQTLKLLGCVYLFELPKDLSNLICLRHLELDQLFWYKCSRLPPRIGNLTSLHNLHKFPIRLEGGHGIEELKNMRYLTGTLQISNLENAVNVGEANLKEKRGLQKLVLEWSSRDGLQHVQESDGMVLEGLQPHWRLKELKICHCRGTQIPTWMRNGLLKNLTFLSLYYCTGCKFLTLGLPGLKVLHIKGMQDLEVWQGEECPSLFKLQISNCPKLRDLPSFCHSVKLLMIKRCNSLKALPVAPDLVVLTLVENLVLEGWNALVKNDQTQSGVSIHADDDDWNAMQGPSSSNSESVCMSLMQHVMINLQELIIIGCPKVQSLPQIFRPKRLLISRCQSLQSLPSSQQTQRLTHLTLRSCHDSILGEHIPHSPSLCSMVISDISKLISLPGLPDLPRLLHLYIHGCQDLASLFQEGEWWRNVPRLYTFSISNCSKLTRLPDEGLPTSLECLVIRSCPGLQSLGPPCALKSLTYLKDLCIEDCPKLESLPEQGLPISLLRLRVSRQLMERCPKEEGGGPDWPNIIVDIYDLQIEPPYPQSQPSSSALALRHQQFGCWPVMKADRNNGSVFLDHKRKKKWTDNKSGYICFMLYPRSIDIAWGGDERYWAWDCYIETSDEIIEVAKLLAVCWLAIEVRLKMSELSPEAEYEAAYVVKLTNGATGWEAPTLLTLTVPNEQPRETRVCLEESPRGCWMELNMGSFRAKAGVNGTLVFSLYNTWPGWKLGLIFGGVVVRPKNSNINILYP